jgi:hypothetical protein
LLLICALQASREAAADGTEPVGRAMLFALSDATAIMPEVIASLVGLLMAFVWWWMKVGDPKALRRADLQPHRSAPMLWPVPVALAIFLVSFAWIGSHQVEQSRSYDNPPRSQNAQIIALVSAREVHTRAAATRAFATSALTDAAN